MMTNAGTTEYVETLVIGGGQAGLSVGYHLRRRGLPFLILDAKERIGDVWRERWDSLRLFTPARYDGLDGMPFPASSHYFPTKDEMADYLESYAARFGLPVRTGVRVDGLTRRNGRFRVTAGERSFEADNVVVAMSDYQRPKVPAFAAELAPDVVQLHSCDYRNPGQLRDGPVLLVGAGNSGSEIARELAPRHEVWMSGRDTGHIPFRIEGLAGRLVLVRLVVRFLFHRVLTVRTPIGRKVRPKILHKGGPLIRVKPKDLLRAGVKRVGKTVGVKNGLPVLEDGRALEVGERDLVHGIPRRLRLDRPPGPRAAGAPTPERDRGQRAGSLLRGALLPARDVVGDDPRRGQGRGAGGGTHRETVREGWLRAGLDHDGPPGSRAGPGVGRHTRLRAAGARAATAAPRSR